MTWTQTALAWALIWAALQALNTLGEWAAGYLGRREDARCLRQTAPWLWAWPVWLALVLAAGALLLTFNLFGLRPHR